MAERQARKAFAQAEERREHPGYRALVAAPPDLRVALASALEELRAALESSLGRGERWVADAGRQILSGRSRVWAELANETRRHLNQIGEKARRASGRRVLGLEGLERGVVKVHATTLLKHLESGRGLGFSLLLPRAVREARYLATSVVVDGARCDRALAVRQLAEWIEAAEGLETLGQLWTRHVEPVRGSFAEQVAGYEDLEEALKQVLELEKRCGAVMQRLAMLPGVAEPVWHEVESLRALEEAVQAATLEEALNDAEAQLSALATTLRQALTAPTAHPVVARLLEGVRARDERAYGEGWAILVGLDRDRDALGRRDDLLRRLRSAARALAARLQEDCATGIWDRRLQRFCAAWNWARADWWLKRQGDGPGVEALGREAEVHGWRVRELVRDLAAAMAWKHCFAPERFTEGVRQHLEAWAKAVVRVGKGTRPRAALHRRAAQDHMRECRSAIPAWIMPLYRVAETVRPGVDLYDVVIVDEASQSGPEALFLHYLAKKLVVVGDDKQISPDFVGLERQSVDLLRQRHLTDIPHNDALGVENSFFDQAEIRFGGRIRLREHFRCMPEIIQFSNNLCYRSEPLIPLRQYGASRLPPVVVRHVSDGYETGHPPRVINRPEADAVVTQIQACLQDRAYADKSIGVISLLGEGQAREIERLLLKRIGPEEMEKRQLVCGDAYAFQGTERDVMFLSLVVAPRRGGRIATLASLRDHRRFNVAASRARDQMWLFHTVTLNDLSPQCVRYALLRYCQDPHVESDPGFGLRLEELAAVARGPREKGSQPPPFDSWFEVDVFLAIARREYRVVPQYSFAGYRIDLLIEGMRGRLAVECDGDDSHGPERYEHDMARQRMLERCGLRFWRVRGSAFYRDPERALDELWDVLARSRIYPCGTEINEREPEHGSRGGGAVIPEAERGSGEGQSEDPSYSGRPATAEDDDEADDPQQDGETAQENETTQRDGVRRAPAEPERGVSLAPVSQARVPSAVLPYNRWNPRPVPDPRTAGIDAIVGALVEIIETEGPLFCYAAYRTYVKAAGFQRVGREMRSNLNRAVADAVRRKLVATANELGTRDQVNQVVRKLATPPVRLRLRGPRTFHDIPPSEVCALVKELRATDPRLEGDELLEAVLQVWDVGRTTSQIRERFAECLRRCGALSDGAPLDS
jgi:very-short-patch-repair endonuclease